MFVDDKFWKLGIIYLNVDLVPCHRHLHNIVAPSLCQQQYNWALNCALEKSWREMFYCSKPHCGVSLERRNAPAGIDCPSIPDTANRYSFIARGAEGCWQMKKNWRGHLTFLHRQEEIIDQEEQHMLYGALQREGRGSGGIQSYL